MKGNRYVKVGLFFVILLLFLPTIMNLVVTANGTKQLIYDSAGLLNQEEIAELEALAKKYGAKRKTDFIIITINEQGKDVEKYTEDFYDENALGYDQPHGNTAILTIDMQERDVYLAGFYKAKSYLDDGRLDLIREQITSDLSAGNYYDAFHSYIKTSYKYMGIRPGVNPNNPLFNGWVQLIISIGIAGIVVGLMAYSSGGRVTVNERTYRNANTSRVFQRKDTYIRTSTTKHKKPTNNNSGGGLGGGGGGVTSGGHSHSGSRGKF